MAFLGRLLARPDETACSFTIIGWRDLGKAAKNKL